MSIWELIKYFAIGIGLNLVLSFVMAFVPYLLFIVYSPWFFLGSAIDPMSGPASHAMVSLGVLLGMVVGFFVYSLLLGLAFRRYRRKGFK